MHDMSKNIVLIATLGDTLNEFNFVITEYDEIMWYHGCNGIDRQYQIQFNAFVIQFQVNH